MKGKLGSELVEQKEPGKRQEAVARPTLSCDVNRVENNMCSCRAGTTTTMNARVTGMIIFHQLRVVAGSNHPQTSANTSSMMRIERTTPIVAVMRLRFLL